MCTGAFGEAYDLPVGDLISPGLMLEYKWNYKTITQVVLALIWMSSHGVQHPINMSSGPVIVLMGGLREGLQWGHKYFPLN